MDWESIAIVFITAAVVAGSAAAAYSFAGDRGLLVFFASFAIGIAVASKRRW